MLLGVVCFIRFTSIFSKKCNTLLTDFVMDLHLLNFKLESEYSKKMNLFIHKLSHFFSVYSIILIIITASTFNVGPIVINIYNLYQKYNDPLTTNMTYEHAVYFALPFDYEHNLKGYFVICFINIYYSIMCGMILVTYDLVIALIVFHLCGHIKILINNLEDFPRPGFKGQVSNANASTMRYTDEEMLEVTDRLKVLIKCHNFTIKYNNKISNTIGVNVAIYFIFHQISGCLLLLQCSQLDIKSLISFIPLTIALIELLVRMSIVFEVIKSMSDPLMQAAYGVPWECMDVKNRKLLLLLLKQTQLPMGLKAMGIVDVGIQTMVMILKTTFSYYMMLRAFEKK
ncbi:uncharacterized protein LOC106143623 [Amyelois transitella]|uniref:uncharacterized protein LOC106143623 n=1 Tax=Amyelois transitella TaxID=680683 RepID=UPI00298FAABE|nr:uncharacterized protein LOC106143623 [Amyelois transitella]